MEQYIYNQIQEWKESIRKTPLIIGLQGPQGSGKSYLSHKLANDTIEIISLDDFYIPYSQQQELHSKNPDNPLLELRGNPGTHDLVLLEHVLQELTRGQSVQSPIYDKSLHHGRGDRTQEYLLIHPKPVIIIEGWCIGFQPLKEMNHQLLASHSFPFILNDSHLIQLNKYVQEMHRIVCLDALIQLKAENLSLVYEWRWQQEQELIDKKGQGQSRNELKRFIDGFMPAYHLYLPGLDDVLSIPHYQLVLNEKRELTKGATSGQLI